MSSRRAPAGYAAIVGQAFADVEVIAVAKHLRIPYTGCVLIARRPRREPPPRDDHTPSQPA